ncbi:Alpha-L-arabinofuranosidase A [Pseudocercospora fuligena]|uniref:non-reducing end alpha-L-arabinofuranosidase n=1 Tax=Pseudocercospora fuligena TaxID=685502 RepID=A0A8H6RUQ6_9PEZI|nr:Alpha-L-arabinofuranosidase A [Pseudocercospora fuligena]
MVALSRAALTAACIACSAAYEISVKASGGNVTGKFGHPFGYGFLHEDINNSGDGGIYAELIQNRAFQSSPDYPVNLDHYFSVNGARLSIQNLSEPISDALPSSMRVAAGNEIGLVGFKNDGYWGMDVRQQDYTGSFWVRGAYTGTFTATLQSNITDEVFGSVNVTSKSVADDWTEHEFTLVPEKDAPSSNNTFAITFDPANAEAEYLDFNLISLFPPTYKGRKNGLRIDIAEALADMNPTFLRFPGGNMLEGSDLAHYWDWKDTLKPLRYRPGFQGVWSYQQTHGLGLMEYLYWAEDMGLEIVVAVWAGLALDGNVTSQDQLQPFIDDALNEIEFISGPADSEWGAKRAELGHPEPFELNYVEVGNEDWLAGYPEGWESYKEYRFPMFYKAISAAYPHIQVIASGATSDPAPEGETFGPNKTDGLTFPEGVIGDYHPYREPDELVGEFDRFDNDIGHIIGEVAATHVNGATPPRWDGGLYKFPWWIGAVGEAVSLIGYERNSDRIPGTFYAPVLRNMNRWQWAITLVQYAADPKLTTKAVTWYCWSLFAHHPITHTVPTTSDTSYGPLYWGAGKDDRRNAFVWKGAVFNTTGDSDVPVTVLFEGLEEGAQGNLTVLTNPGGDPYAYNDPFLGVNIVNTETTILTAGAGGAFTFSLPQLSVAVLDTESAGNNWGAGHGKPPRYGPHGPHGRPPL